MQNEKKFSEFTNHLIEKGFFFPNAEIYGGLTNAWDYGPLGTEIQRIIKETWWNFFVKQENNVVGLNSNILIKPNVLHASGHLKNFVDYFIECKTCHKRYRVDHFLIENNINFTNQSINDSDVIEQLIKHYKLVCKHCKNTNFTKTSQFNLLFQTGIGAKTDNKNQIYLRPETAQGIFINLKRIQRSLNLKFPFGVAQIGKSFRNEITTGHFIFRTLEFEQMELEFFFENKKDSKYYFNYWKNKTSRFLTKIGLNADDIVIRNHNNKELAHYSQQTIDFEYKFPFGQKELCGISDRGCFDLTNHSQNSNTKLEFLNSNNHKFIPRVIEPSLGVERLMLAVLWHVFVIEKLTDQKQRIVLNLLPRLCPVQIAFLPLVKKLSPPCIKIWQLFNLKYRTNFHVNNSIGKRYRYHDSIGTYFCITFDFESLVDNKITVRNRNTMEQQRIAVTELPKLFKTTFNSK